MPKRILIIGAGPVGVEAAASFLCSTDKDKPVVHMVEREAEVGGGILRNWPHVLLFSPWSMNISSCGDSLLEMSQKVDVSICPTGKEFCQQYLQPVIEKLQENFSSQFSIVYETEVISISRKGHISKSTMGSSIRKSQKFCCLLSSTSSIDGKFSSTLLEEYTQDFDVIVDASGLISTSSYFGPGGIPCVNERILLKNNHLISRNIPSVDIEKYKDKRLAVIGSGYSAATSVRNLLEAQVKEIYWITRKKENNIYEVIDDDALPERKRLCKRSNELISSSSSCVHHYGGMNVVAVNQKKQKHSEDSFLEIDLESISKGDEVTESVTGKRSRTIEVDHIISNTGLRPDLSIHSELQVHICYASDGIMKLAASLLGASGDCLAQPAAGIETLISPEPDFYILGSKSYGRNSSFLLRVGIEQVAALKEKLMNENKQP